jgi:hypothetical protein
MPYTDDQLRELKGDQMQADLDLKRKQVTWETPKNIAILAGAMAAIMAATFGVLGYKIGSQPPQTINVHLDAPLVQPAPTPHN